MVYMPELSLLATGGTDRFISLYNDQKGSGRFKCVQKILKQGANSIINSMCSIDGDKLLVGQTDEYIRLYQIPSYGFSTNEADQLLALDNPITMYKFEDSGINNLCQLNDKNLFISSGFNRSISVWDTRQTQPILFFKDIHYDKISAIDKFNTEIFASASEDGFVNVSATLVSNLEFIVVGPEDGRVHQAAEGGLERTDQLNQVRQLHAAGWL